MATNEEIRAKDILPHKTSFSAGDGFYGDGPQSFFMEAEKLLELTAENALAGNVASAFDPTRDTEHPYLVGEDVIEGGKLYKCIVEHSGVWNASHFIELNVMDYVEANLLTCLKVKSPFISGNSASNPAHLSDVGDNTVYIVFRTAVTTIDDFPSDYTLSSGIDNIGILKTYKSVFTSDIVWTKYQVLERPTLNKYWVRYISSTSGAWSKWTASKENFVQYSKNAIFLNEATNPSDLNDIKDNVVILIKRTNATTTQHFPSDYPADSSNGYLFVTKASFTASVDLVFQLLFIPSSGYTWIRIYSSATSVWGDWSKNGIDTSTLLSVGEHGIFQNQTSNPTDLDDLTGNTVILVKRGPATATQHFPSDYPTGNENAYLFVNKAVFIDTASLSFQLLFIPTLGKSWMRVYSSTTQVWGDWTKCGGLITTEITVGDGGDFATLREAFNYAYDRQNCIVKVLPGTYNLLTEFADKLHSINSQITGLPCGNGMKILFYDGALVTAEFDNSESEWTQSEWEQILDYFNPFYAGTGDFEIENLNIIAQNCRYCFHDERAGSGTYHHVFKNCHMVKKTTTPERRYMCCIGGGLGRHGTIVIDGGDYKSETTYGIDVVDNSEPSSAQMCILWHNGFNASAKSSVEIKDVYLHDRGYVCIRDHGQSPYVTKVLVDGCSFGLPIAHFKTSAGGATDNMEVIDWNNEQRVQGVHWEPSVDGSTIDLVAD